MLAKQEALADLDGIDPSNIVETSGRPRRAAAAKVDYRAVLKIEGLDSEDRCPPLQIIQTETDFQHASRKRIFILALALICASLVVRQR